MARIPTTELRMLPTTPRSDFTTLRTTRPLNEEQEIAFQYKDPGENGGAGNDAGLEGSLIEYCRLDAPSMGRQPPRHSVCEPASVVTVSHSIRPNGPALGNWALRGKSSVSSLGSTGSKVRNQLFVNNGTGTSSHSYCTTISWSIAQTGLEAQSEQLVV